jgi:hypothetical protein
VTGNLLDKHRGRRWRVLVGGTLSVTVVAAVMAALPDANAQSGHLYQCAHDERLVCIDGADKKDSAFGAPADQINNEYANKEGDEKFDTGMLTYDCDYKNERLIAHCNMFPYKGQTVPRFEGPAFPVLGGTGVWHKNCSPDGVADDTSVAQAVMVNFSVSESVTRSHSWVFGGGLGDLLSGTYSETTTTTEGKTWGTTTGSRVVNSDKIPSGKKGMWMFSPLGTKVKYTLAGEYHNKKAGHYFWAITDVETFQPRGRPLPQDTKEPPADLPAAEGTSFLKLEDMTDEDRAQCGRGPVIRHPGTEQPVSVPGFVTITVTL